MSTALSGISRIQYDMVRNAMNTRIGRVQGQKCRKHWCACNTDGECCHKVCPRDNENYIPARVFVVEKERLAREQKKAYEEERKRDREQRMR